MKVSQIIEMVDKFLNLQLPRVLFEPNGEEVLLQQEAKTDKVQSLVDCCNVVCDELAHNYAPLYRKKVVNASDGIVPFEDLDDLIEVFSLKDSDGSMMVTSLVMVSVRPSFSIVAVMVTSPAASGIRHQSS